MKLFKSILKVIGRLLGKFVAITYEGFVEYCEFKAQRERNKI